MAFARFLPKIPWIAFATLAAISNAGAQAGSPPRQSPVQAPAAARIAASDAKRVSPPSVLHFCAAHCSTWYLANDGSGYAGVSGYPSIPKYSPGVTIERFSRDAVVLVRNDPPNQWFPKGLSAVITVQIAPGGNRLVHGRQTWIFGQSGLNIVEITWGPAINEIPGAGEPSPSIFAQDLDPPALDDRLPPTVLHFCAAHCATWYLTNDHKGYTGVAGFPDVPEGLGVSIASFTRDSVVLNRSDPPNQWFPSGLKAVITGTVSPQGNTLENGKIQWTAGQSGTFDAQISWGTGLNAIPGQDAPAQSFTQKLDANQALQNLVLMFLLLPSEPRCRKEFPGPLPSKMICQDY